MCVCEHFNLTTHRLVKRFLCCFKEHANVVCFYPRLIFFRESSSLFFVNE